MRAVLGIDAAWTLTQPSGVAVAAEYPEGWRIVAAASSYQHFQALADSRLVREAQPLGSSPDAPALLSSAAALCGGPVSLVAIDMPLALSPIVARRPSDDAVSRAYGGKKCGTHTPSASRPGRISDDLLSSFERAGYPLCTERITSPGLIEVYPHPALVELAGAAERLPYKCSKARKYWPSLTVPERWDRLYQQWREIGGLLETKIGGLSMLLPELALDASTRDKKGYEDILDAAVCAWVAVCALDGQAKPFGDHESAIWIPV